jgi:NAD(P)-dependent dehydrogenase (short-subunit alcohol dehydrogenase family)
VNGVKVEHDGRAAIVTGGARGIGRAYALGLAGQDADVSDPAQVGSAVAAVASQLGSITILVNNAAIYGDLELRPLVSVDIAYWRKNFAVNLEGALLVTQRVAPMMQDAGWGRVVMQTTAGAYSNTGGHYTASKLALVNLTKGFARELGPAGATVNAIAPGVILTDATRSTLSADVIERLIASQLVPVRAQAEDLVPALLFLCSEGARFVTGQTLLVDGGLTQRV